MAVTRYFNYPIQIFWSLWFGNKASSVILLLIDIILIISATTFRLDFDISQAIRPFLPCSRQFSTGRFARIAHWIEGLV
jgi:hypothetical protein